MSERKMVQVTRDTPIAIRLGCVFCAKDADRVALTISRGAARNIPVCKQHAVMLTCCGYEIALFNDSSEAEE